MSLSAQEIADARKYAINLPNYDPAGIARIIAPRDPCKRDAIVRQVMEARR